MIPIERHFHCSILGEQLSEIDGAIAVLETSLGGDGYNREVEAYAEASMYLLRARKALERAQAEARGEFQDILLQLQLQESVLRFPLKVTR